MPIRPTLLAATLSFHSVIALLLLFAASAVSAQPVISPGAERTISGVDGGDRNCRRGTQALATQRLDCGGRRFRGTFAHPNENRVRARVNFAITGAPGLGIPNYATANLYKDIFIAGSPDTFVNVQISVGYDYRNLFVLAAAYLVKSGLSFGVIDLTAGKTVTTQTLFETSRDSDQGIELALAVAAERQVVTDATNSFSLLLRRGRYYRLVFEIEAMAQVPIAGAVEANARADLKSVTVRIDEDEVELLKQHDMDIKNAIANHDHDVKALLNEVIRLLHTPTGRRETDAAACDGGPCDFPNKGKKN